jgi:hypothetical protein
VIAGGGVVLGLVALIVVIALGAARGDVDETATTEVAVELPSYNQFGDPVGSSPTSGHPAALFAIAMQAGRLDDRATAEHTDAYYALVWSNVTGRVDADAAVVTTDAGYRMRTTADDRLEMRHARLDAEGRVASYTEVLDGVAAGVPTGIDDLVDSTGVCLPPPEHCIAGFAPDGGAAFSPDLNGNGYRLFVLASIDLDRDRPALIVFVDPPDGVADTPDTITASRTDVRIGREPTTDLLVVSYPDTAEGDTLGLAITTITGIELGFEIDLSR